MTEASPPRKTGRRIAVHAGLFAATALTVFLTGALTLPASSLAEARDNGLAFACALLGILACHEAGHFIAARRRRIDASWPYFIPMPPVLSLFGTMGAVILMRGRIRSRDALLEVGAAGPLAGAAVALPLLFFGLADCPVGPLPEEGLMEGQSLLYLLAKRVVLGPIPDGFDVYIDHSPLAWAGWIGLFVTALNLLPIGQLDGGHILCALMGNGHARASRWFVRALFALGAAVCVGLGMDAAARGLNDDAVVAAAMPGIQWFVLGGLLALLHRRRGFSHPPFDPDGQTLSRGHRAIGILCVVLFVATFMPIAMRPIG